MSLSVSPPPSAVAVITPERSPRPTSAPAIAQSHAAEPVPAKPDVKDVVAASKAEREVAKPDARREEIPPEKTKPEPADASKVGQGRVFGSGCARAGLEHRLRKPPQSSSSMHLPLPGSEGLTACPGIRWEGGTGVWAPGKSQP